MINIRLNHHDQPQVPFLTIPRNDVKRLSNSPFRWIRYVMFAICGARGDISMTPDGPPVNYDDILLEDGANLYYTPSGDCHFVDHEALNDRISTNSTARQYSFKQALVDRDGCCIVTGVSAPHCHAAHLIPHSKGNEYINKVTQDRSSLYLSPSLISDIDAVENRVLLRGDLHDQFGVGDVAFIKTPNYGLESTDIPRLYPHTIPGTNHSITLHQLRPFRVLDLAMLQGMQDRLLANQGGAHTDVRFSGRDRTLPPPPDIILDYLYGVAAYKLWRSDPHSVDEALSTYHREQYRDIPPLPRRSPSTASQAVTEGDDSERPLDRDYFPSSSEDEMSQAMDDLNLALMRISGITPQELADRRKKKAEEEEQVAQETSRRKVAQWMEHRTSHGTIAHTGLSSNTAYTLSSNTAHADLSSNAAHTLSSNTAYPHLSESSNTANMDLSSHAADTDLSPNAAYR